MLREPTYRIDGTMDDAMGWHDGGPFCAPPPDARHLKRPDSAAHSEDASEWGDSIASQAYQDAYGAMSEEHAQRVGRGGSFAAAGSSHGMAGAGPPPLHAALLSSSDDIVTALMEFEGVAALSGDFADADFWMCGAGAGGASSRPGAVWPNAYPVGCEDGWQRCCAP
eukprot:5546065-Prymnesium_polylepis.1